MSVISRASRDSRAKSGGQSQDTFLSTQELREMVNLFKILSDETRLKIIQFLLQQPEYHVRAMCDMLGQSQPAVSHHLALLRMAGVIECRRDGKHNYYHLLPKRFCEIRNAIQATSSSRKAWDRLFTD